MAMARTYSRARRLHLTLLSLLSALLLWNAYGHSHILAIADSTSIRRPGLAPTEHDVPQSILINHLNRQLENIAGDPQHPKETDLKHEEDERELVSEHDLRLPIVIDQHNRQLENGTDIPQDPTDLPSCNDILLNEKNEERCHHAKNCEGEYIMTTLLPLAFCNDPSTPSPLDSHPILLRFFPILFPLSLFLLTLLLFRLLGSTAENYFSPALEMISSEFHIPPPLAGVTLLALGNGAPDVSAVVNAIKMSASEGIPLSLGELTGGGMFVQTVVVGRIVFLGSSIVAGTGKKKVAGEKILGVTCREELIRDITMYAISAGFVFWVCSRGVIFYRHVVAMLLLYCGYVAVVVVFEIRRYYSNSSPAEGDIEVYKNEEGAGEMLDGEGKIPLIHTTTPSFDEEDQTVELSPRRRDPSDDLLGVNGTRKQPDPPGIKQSARVLRVIQKQQMRQQQRLMEKRGSNQPPQDRSQRSEDRPWSFQLFSESVWELFQHFHDSLYTDIWSSKNAFEWFCQSLESPFTIMRKLVTPIPCEAEYNRSLVAYSIAFSPFWLSFYLSTKMDGFDPFCTNNGMVEDDGFCFPSVFWPCCISFAIGCAVIKYAPKDQLPLHYSLPIALYGFLIAATWIDVTSDQLVNVLEFIGVLLRIPAPIMGMTVLAWGNSVGDYTTNGALAQRGLADMSMAACFAGPSFNLLVGLGCGLLTQKESLMSDGGLPISLMPSVQTGFIFLICNCAITIFSGIWNKGVIPKIHGYIFWGMYFAYMTMNAQHLTM